jgi:ribosomal protein S18 acetylase RimI-like enzyme
VPSLGDDADHWEGRARVSVRPATDEDWDEIYAIFTQVVEEGRTYAYPAGLSSGDAKALWMEQDPGVTVVAVVGGRIGGTAKMGPNRPGRGSHVATASFMVHPVHRRHGIATALASHAIEWTRASGYRAIQFNAVVETNTGAIELWKKLGFEILATVPEAFDDAVTGYVGLHVMYRSLR